MTIVVRDATASRNVKAVSVRDTTNALRTIIAIYVRDSTGLRRVFTVANATANPTSVRGAGASGNSITVQTQQTTVSAPGAQSFAWSQTSGDGNWSVVNPSSNVTAFRRSGCAVGSSYQATFSCVASFSGGLTSSAGVSAFVVNNGDIRGGSGTQ